MVTCVLGCCECAIIKAATITGLLLLREIYNVKTLLSVTLVMCDWISENRPNCHINGFTD